MSTLPSNVTPFEVLTDGRKPDLSHLRVWGCDCYVAIPDEIRGKAGPKRFQAIFVGYEEHRVGWRVRDLKGKYSFSNDVIFNENLPARLGVPRPLLSFSPAPGISSPPHIVPDRPCIRTALGQAYDEVIALKRSRNESRQRKQLPQLDDVADGGADVRGCVAVVVDAGPNGGVSFPTLGPLALAGGSNDLSPLPEAIDSFVSYLDSSSFPCPVLMDSLIDLESVFIDSFSSFNSFAFKAFSPPFSQPFDLSKPPFFLHGGTCST